MGNLYLDSGESIIQTTDRISVNSIASDLLLTNRRLILVDSTHSRLDPLMIPFATIVSLQGGWNNSGEPVITFTLTDPDDGNTQLLDLVFFQQPGEHRKDECDGWVQYLMDHIVQARQESIRADVPASARESGMQPSVRRWVAPDMIRPHTTIIPLRPVPSGEVITPVQTDALGVIKEEEELPAPSAPIGEEVAGSSPDSVQEPESPDAVDDREPDGIVSPFVPDEPADSPVAETHAVPEAFIPTTVPEQEPELPETILPQLPDEPADSPVAETHAVPDTLIPTTVPEQEPELPETILPQLPDEPADSPVAETHAVPDTLIPTTVPEQEPESPEIISPSETKVIVAGEPAAHGTPLPSPGSPSQTKLPVIAIGLILLVIAGGAGFFALYMAGGDTGSHNTGTAPTLTLSHTPTPTLPQLIIPASGVWVRVSCNSTFVGWIGNPGSLRMISGTGDQFYKIQNSDDLVQASFQKQEYTGDTLTVGIYNNGELITHRTVTAPRGTIDFIIDAKTGNPPGLPTDRTR